MSVQIRALEAADFGRGVLDALGSLAPVDLTPDEATAIWRQRSAAGIHTIVAAIDGQVVGTASLIVEKKYIHRGGLVGHIEDVAVHSDHWRKGIGTALVEHLTRLASALHCYKVILNCHDHLVPFYSRIGYRRHDSGLRCDCPLDHSAD
jgi:glucosamine-phosphate N-acetyltransferase